MYVVVSPVCSFFENITSLCCAVLHSLWKERSCRLFRCLLCNLHVHCHGNFRLTVLPKIQNLLGSLSAVVALILVSTSVPAQAQLIFSVNAHATNLRPSSSVLLLDDMKIWGHHHCNCWLPLPRVWLLGTAEPCMARLIARSAYCAPEG
jgi:hypothetical protein